MDQPPVPDPTEALLQHHRDNDLFRPDDNAAPAVVEDVPQSFDFSRGLADMRVKDAARFQRHMAATQLTGLRGVAPQPPANPRRVPHEPPAPPNPNEEVRPGRHRWYSSAIVDGPELTLDKLAEAIADVRPDGKIFWSEWMTVRGGAKRETELAAVSVAFELVHKVLAHFSVPCVDIPKNQQAWQDYKKKFS
jgi:hypothetical protein